MAGYTKIVRSIWHDDDFKALAATTQRAYFMLVSQPDLTQCGILAITPGRWAQLAADTDTDDIRAEMLALEAAGFIVIDHRTEELWVRSFMKYDEGYRVPNIAKAITNSCEAISSKPLRRQVAKAVLTLGVTLPVTLERTLGESLQPVPVPAAAAEPPREPSESPGGSNLITDERSAAAIEMLIESKCSTARNPAGLRRKLRRELPSEHAAALAAYIELHAEATTTELAAYVLKVPGLSVAQSEPRRDWYANPDCPDCEGSGTAKLDDAGQGTYGPCPCRRPEPYPTTPQETDA